MAKSDAKMHPPPFLDAARMGFFGVIMHL